MSSRLIMFCLTACALASSIAIAAHGAPNRAAVADCYPNALIPYVEPGPRKGLGQGIVSCYDGASATYTIRLVTLAENILAQRTGGPITGGQTVQTAFVSCAGANVHSFLYINVGGQGKSDTSGNNSDCTY